MANEPTSPSNHKPRKKDDGGSTSKKEEDALTVHHDFMKWLSNSTVCADLMLSILTKLDFETLMKCKSVCCGWENLITHPEFARLYDAKRSSFLSSAGVVLQSHQLKSADFGFNPWKVLHAIKEDDENLDMYIQSCHGIVCWAHHSTSAKNMYLWNPATNHCKTLESGVWIGGKPQALGFGCNTQEYDYKVIRIFMPTVEVYSSNMPTVEVYSSKNDSWQKIDCTLEFQILEKYDLVNVKGNPFWEVKVNGQNCLLQFDCMKNSFNIVREMDEGERQLTYVEWEGELACLSSEQSVQGEFIVVSVFDEEDWRIKAKIGPMPFEVGIQNCIQCSKINRIVVLSRDFKLFLVDVENLNCIHLSELEKKERWPLMILPYNPTVAHIKGMQPLTKVHEDCEESLTNVIQGFIIGCVKEATGEVVCIYVL